MDPSTIIQQGSVGTNDSKTKKESQNDETGLWNLEMFNIHISSIVDT